MQGQRQVSPDAAGPCRGPCLSGRRFSLGVNVIQELELYDFNMVLDPGAAEHVVDDSEHLNIRYPMEQGAEREAVSWQQMDNPSRTKGDDLRAAIQRRNYVFRQARSVGKI